MCFGTEEDLTPSVYQWLDIPMRIPVSAGFRSAPMGLRRWRWVGVGEIPDSHRWDSSPKISFAPDSPLERRGFEPLVPLVKKGRGPSRPP